MDKIQPTEFDEILAGCRLRLESARYTIAQLEARVIALETVSLSEQEEPDTLVTSWIRSDERLSTEEYNLAGKPTWWAALENGKRIELQQNTPLHGDKYMAAQVSLPPGTRVVIGISNQPDMIEIVTTTPY